MKETSANGCFPSTISLDCGLLWNSKKWWFDVIIGNPPYVEYSQVRESYQIKGYATEGSGNLYAFCTERSINLLRTKGMIGFIVQQPLVSTQRMKATRDFLLQNTSLAYISNMSIDKQAFDWSASRRMAIFLSQKEKTPTYQSFVNQILKMV